MFWASPVHYKGIYGGVRLIKLDKQTYTSEFESHWVPHTNGPVPHLSKKLSKLLLQFTTFTSSAIDFKFQSITYNASVILI